MRDQILWWERERRGSWFLFLHHQRHEPTGFLCVLARSCAPWSNGADTGIGFWGGREDTWSCEVEVAECKRGRRENGMTSGRDARGGTRRRRWGTLGRGERGSMVRGRIWVEKQRIDPIRWLVGLANQWQGRVRWWGTDSAAQLWERGQRGDRGWLVDYMGRHAAGVDKALQGWLRSHTQHERTEKEPWWWIVNIRPMVREELKILYDLWMHIHMRRPW
jgi:hypothetical protein